MGVLSGLEHTLESILEIFRGILSNIWSLFSAALATVMGLFQTFVSFVEGTLGFAIHNFFILGTVLAAVFGYMLYTQKQGTAPASRAIKGKTS